MVYNLIRCGLLYLLILVAASSCTSSVTTALPATTSSSSPRPATSLLISPTPTQTSLVIQTTTSIPASSTSASISGCQFVYSIPARINLEFVALLSYYKSITLDVNHKSSTLRIVLREGNETVRSLPPALGESTLRDILAYLCGLERLPPGDSSPITGLSWQMSLELEGNQWVIMDSGVISILSIESNEEYLAREIQLDFKNPASLLLDLAEIPPP